MVVRLLSFLFVFCFALTCQGQQISEDDLQQPSDLLLQELNAYGNDSYILQQGNENYINLEQKRLGSSKANLARLLQSGEFNVISVVQNGSGNQTAVIQDGKNNSYNLELLGENNNIVVIQKGDDNVVLQELVNIDDLRIEFIQEGNANEIIQTAEGSVENREFKVTQQGDNMRLIIRQSTPN